MPASYRLKPREIISCILPAPLAGAALSGLGYFWMACGYNFTLLDLTALHTPLWLLAGLIVGAGMAAWLWRLRIRLDHEGLSVERSAGLLRLPATRWPDIATLRRANTGQIGRKRQVLRIMRRDGFCFSLPLDCLPPVGAPSLDARLGQLSGREIAEPPPVQDRNIELGREAGLLTYAALALTAAALGMLVTWRAHYFDGYLHLLVLVPLFLAAVVMALRLQRRAAQRGVSVIIALLFASAWSGFCWCGGMTLAVAAGNKVERPFTLVRADSLMQWRSSDAGRPLSMTATLPASARRHARPGQIQNVRVSVGPLGISALGQDEYVRLIPLD